MYKPIQLVFWLFLLLSCESQTNRYLDYTLVKTEFNTPNCEPETSSCLLINMEYPQFDQGDSMAIFLANRIIKNSILDNIGMGDAEATRELSLEEAIKELNKKFEELKNDFEGYTTGWQADITTEEIFKSDSILVLSIKSITFFGGAHPNTNLRYYNLKRGTGGYLPISNFVKEMKDFTVRAESEFRKTYKVEDGVSFSDAGFDFLGDQFVLSANYAYVGDSIKLHYNPYEISSYAAGEFDITVSIK